MRFIERGVILHVPTRGEEEHWNICSHERCLVASPVAIGSAGYFQVRLLTHIFCQSLEAATGSCASHTHGIITHTPHHIQVHHSYYSFDVVWKVLAVFILSFHPFHKILGAHQPLFLCTEECEDDASG